MNEKELQEFNLDDIIREFSDHTEAPAEPEEMPVQEQSVAEEEPVEEMLPEEPREEEPASAEVTSDTIRLDAIVLPKGQVRNAEPIDDEEEAPREAPDPMADTIRIAVEPFSEQWEPEYEQPMGEYVPPQPILIHPRSRLRELKKQLVEGPEKQYYRLAEKGLGKLQALIFLSFLVVLITAGATLLYTLDMVQADRMRLMVFGQLLGMMISALLGSFQLIEGVVDLIKGRFSLNTLLVFTLLLCAVDGVMCLRELRVPCCAAFSLEVTFSLWSAYQRRRTEMGQMDTLRKATDLTAVRACEEQVEGNTVLLRSEGLVEDFMDRYNVRSAPEKVLSWYTIGALLAALAVGVVGFLLHDLSTAVQVAAITLLAAVPASGFICLTRPAAVLEKKLHKLGTVVCGWPGVEAASGKVIFPLSHSDLFPAGAVKMNGVKFFGNRNTDEVIAYAAAMVTASDSGLQPLFDQLLESRNGRHLKVDALRDYDGGVGGEIRDEPVLIGNLSFLRTMGVEVPEGLRVSQALCVAIDGELCGLFAITYEKMAASAAGLTTLSAYHGLTPVITAGDLLLTPGFLHAKFGISTKNVSIGNAAMRTALKSLEVHTDLPAVALTTKDGLAPIAFGVTGARALHSACKLGVTLHMIGGLVGIAIMLLLVLLGAIHLLTPANVFLYQLVWAVPCLLITEWTRLI